MLRRAVSLVSRTARPSPARSSPGRPSPGRLSPVCRRGFTTANAPPPSPSPSAAGDAPSPTGIRLLMARYGRTALVAYIGVSTIDLGACYLLVRTGGADFVGSVEHFITHYITGDRFSLGGLNRDSN